MIVCHILIDHIAGRNIVFRPADPEFEEGGRGQHGKNPWRVSLYFEHI